VPQAASKGLRKRSSFGNLIVHDMSNRHFHGGTMSSPTRLGVLVADDEPTILRLLELGLTSQGFVVWAAASGQEALDLFQQHAGEIELALLDVQMPALDGPQTLAALRALRPALKCCFMSGNTGAYTEQELLDCGAVRVFHKPFNLAELMAYFRRLTGHSERRAGLRLVADPSPVILGGQQAQMRDHSTGGLGLWVSRPVVVGSVLALQFASSANLERAVEVRHCQPQADGWSVGCRFVG
jgi:DNA-binding response OmpR family regulator